MKVTLDLTCTMASAAETTMKNTMSTRMRSIWDFCSVFLPCFPRTGTMRSSVNVEEEVRTSEESVDMDAERTSTMTIATTMFGRFSSIFGTMLS